MTTTTPDNGLSFPFVSLSRTALIAFMALCLCCNAANAAKKKQPIPAGLDTTTHREADSLAKQLFGEKVDEETAKRAFEKGQEDFRWGKAALEEADSMRRTGIDTTMKKPGGLLGPFRRALGDSAESSREKETRQRADESFRRAAREFERALEISPPMRREVQPWLAAAYGYTKEWEKSAAVYRELLNERQGDDLLWFNYGYAALQGGLFDKAVNAFEQAIRISLLVQGDSAKIDNRYRVYAGEAFMRTYQDQLSLERLRDAERHALPEDAAEIRRTIEWILWDDGGIRAAEHRDAAYRAENESHWNDAKREYQAGIDAARTQRAHDELSYRLALLEYRGFSKIDGLGRMQKLIESSAEVSSEYRESYGKMLFAYAQDLEKDSDLRGALAYFLQATKFPWSGQGAGHVEIARIAGNDLDQAIEQATLALNYPLTEDQQRSAYRILEESYRAKGDWDRMKYYHGLLEAQR